MTLSFASILQLASKGMETFTRFPLALLSSILTTCIAIYFIASSVHELKGVSLILAKLAMTSMLGVFVFMAVRLLGYSVEKRTELVLIGLGFLGLLLYYFSLPVDMHIFDASLYVFRHIFLSIFFFISILWTPFINTNHSNVDYWEYVKSVLLALLMTINFTIVIALGLNAAMGAIGGLFELPIEDKHFFMLNVGILGVFSVWYFLSQIPQNPASIKASLPPPRVEKFFTLYVLTPLTVLYFIILYAYTAKILASMDWPKGILAWLIVAFSAVAVLTYLFWTHFAADKTSKWRRWIWLAVFVQTLLLFTAIAMRIMEYSWTENRYMILLLGVWLASISLYFLIKKEAKIKWIFISLSVLISISQIGPFSAYAVSKKAQTLRLKTQLEVLKKVSDVKDAPLKVRYDISEGIGYLYNRHGVKVLEPIFPKISAEFQVLDKQKKDVEIFLREQDSKVSISRGKSKEAYEKIQNIFKDKPAYYPEYLTHELGFKFINSWDYYSERNGTIQNIYFQIMDGRGEEKHAYDIREYDYMTGYYGNTSFTNHKKTIVTPLRHLDNINVSIAFEGNIFKIYKEKEVLTINIKLYIEELIQKHGMHPTKLTQKDLTLQKENNAFKVKIEFQHLNKSSYGDEKRLDFNARILFKIKGEN